MVFNAISTSSGVGASLVPFRSCSLLVSAFAHRCDALGILGINQYAYSCPRPIFIHSQFLITDIDNCNKLPVNCHIVVNIFILNAINRFR